MIDDCIVKAVKRPSLSARSVTFRQIDPQLTEPDGMP